MSRLCDVSDQPKEVQEYSRDYMRAAAERAVATKDSPLSQSYFNLLLAGCPKTSIACIDNKDEHTPTRDEWKTLTKTKTFKRFVNVLGGIEKVKLVPSGSRPVLTNYEDCVEYVKAHPDCKMVPGWYILIGKPTLIQFNPHFWIEDATGKWIAVSGEGEESMCYATAKEDHMKLAFFAFSEKGGVPKSPCLRPVFPNHQTLAQFEDDGAFGSKATFPVPVPRSMDSKLNFEEQKEE